MRDRERSDGATKQCLKCPQQNADCDCLSHCLSGCLSVCLSHCPACQTGSQPAQTYKAMAMAMISSRTGTQTDADTWAGSRRYRYRYEHRYRYNSSIQSRHYFSYFTLFSPTANVDNLKYEMQKYRTHTHAQDPIQGPPTQMK